MRGEPASANPATPAGGCPTGPSHRTRPPTRPPRSRPSRPSAHRPSPTGYGRGPARPPPRRRRRPRMRRAPRSRSTGPARPPARCPPGNRSPAGARRKAGAWSLARGRRIRRRPDRRAGAWSLARGPGNPLRAGGSSPPRAGDRRRRRGGGGAAPGGGTPGGGTPGGGGAVGSLRLPDQVGGLPRIPLGDASLLGGQQGLLDLLGGSGALDGYGLGAYGPDASDPRFVLLVVRTREASSAGPIAGTMVDALRDTLGDLSEPQAFTRNGVRYECADGSLGGLCSFQNGATVGVGFSRDSDLDQLSRLTDEARRGARG